MFWKNNTPGQAFVTYLMMVMMVGIMMVQFPRSAYSYFAIVQIVGLFVLYSLLRR